MMRTFGHPPFMQELIQNLGTKGAPSHLRKSHNLHVLIDLLGWLGAPYAPRSCMSSCINGDNNLIRGCPHRCFTFSQDLKVKMIAYNMKTGGQESPISARYEQFELENIKQQRQHKNRFCDFS